MTRTYYVASKGRVRRLDNLATPWVSVDLAPSIPGGEKVILLDVETDTNNSDKVFAVGNGVLSNGNYGIYVSTDAGLTWYQPGGNYQTNFDGTGKFQWYEVSVVDSNNIFVSGRNGYVAKSTDGGLTFNLTTQVPSLPTCTTCPSQISPVFSVHFITPNIGVIGLFAHALYTFDAGATWTILNSGNIITGLPNGDIYIISGIHISADQQTIVALSTKNIFVSSDAGNTWTNIYQFSARNGLHLTWTDDLNLWAFGKGKERVRTTDGGLTWTTIAAYLFTGPDQYAGHFYTNNNGFFSKDASLYSTSDGAITSTISDLNPVIPGATPNLIQAVWTHVDPPICYLLTDCTGIQEPVVVSDDLSSYVGQVVTWCSRVPLRYPLPDPEPCTPVDGCWTVTEAESCEGALPEGSVEITFSYGEDACEECLPTCYLLEDCKEEKDPIITNTDLSQYVGEVIRLNSCPDDCWTVSVAPDCVGATSVGTVLLSFATCEECDPIPLPDPIQLRLRKIKPGYSTPSCNPQYTEKVKCNFAEGIYKEMVIVRYGIEICCDINTEKWLIKNELLNLDSIYDPDIESLLTKTCYCYTITQTVNTVSFTYISCDGCFTTIELNAGDSVNICSQSYPKAYCPAVGSVYEIVKSTTVCTTNDDCAPNCFCYAIEPAKEGVFFSYYNCNNSYIEQTTFVPINICAIESTVTIIEGIGGVANIGNCSAPECSN